MNAPHYTRDLRKVILTTIFLCCCFLFVERSSSSTDSIIDILQAFDHEFQTSYEIKMNVGMRFPVKFDGITTSTVTLLSNGPKRGLISELKQMSSHSYRDNQENKRYDEDGNYKIFRQARRVISLDSEDYCKERIETNVYFVDQENQIKRTKSMKPSISMYPPSHNIPSTFYYQRALPLGRGYSQLLNDVLIVKEIGDEILYVEATGSNFGLVDGTWELEIDTEKDYLVKKALFRVDDSTSSIKINFKNTNYICSNDDDLPINLIGSYEVNVLSLDIVTLSYSRACADNVFIDILSNFSNLSSKTNIYDFNLVDSEGIPLVVRAE